MWECAIRGSGKDVVSVAHCIGEWLRSEEKEIEVRMKQGYLSQYFEGVAQAAKCCRN